MVKSPLVGIGMAELLNMTTPSWKVPMLLGVKAKGQFWDSIAVYDVWIKEFASKQNLLPSISFFAYFTTNCTKIVQFLRCV